MEVVARPASYFSWLLSTSDDDQSTAKNGLAVLHIMLMGQGDDRNFTTASSSFTGKVSQKTSSDDVDDPDSISEDSKEIYTSLRQSL